MSSVGEGEEVYFDTQDQFMCSNLEFDIWLKEPKSIKDRKESFLSRMGFVVCSTPIEPENVALQRVVESSGAGSDCCLSQHEYRIDDNLLSQRRESHSQANCSVDFSDLEWLDDISIEADGRTDESSQQYEVEACMGDSPIKDKKNEKKLRWWRHFVRKMRKERGANKISRETNLFTKDGTMRRMRIEQTRKRCMEYSAVYAGQELKAHNGLIWTMKFSPDGQYLASGGQDGVVCVWRVSCKAGNCHFAEGVSSPWKKKSNDASVVNPEKIFHIDEEPVQRFQGHSSEVLDLSWSTSNHLLSSSMDKTIRLWHVGSAKCLGVFEHTDYVTCVQFSPVDENHFISGSIDGKVRIWGIPKRRVDDWANVRDIVTAICYQSNGKGFVVGSVSGTCCFYEISGDEILLNAEINIQGRKKSRGNRINGIQFLKNDSQRIMITCEDSKIRILDGVEVVRKYKGPTKSGCQMSASFTSSGRHIISIGEDSHIYMWNYDELSIQTSKQAKSIYSCEHFFSEGASVVLPWTDLDIEPNNTCEASPCRIQDSERFSLANWFSMDGSSRATITWPEEKLPLWDLPSDHHNGNHIDHNHLGKDGSRIQSTTWGLVFVTANWDGTIRTYHNYGLPVRV